MNHQAIKQKTTYVRAISLCAFLLTLPSAAEVMSDRSLQYLEESRHTTNPDRKANLLARAAKMGNKTAFQDLLESVEGELERVKKEGEKTYSTLPQVNLFRGEEMGGASFLSEITNAPKRDFTTLFVELLAIRKDGLTKSVDESSIDRLLSLRMRIYQ